MNLVYNTISANGADVSINGKIITVLNSADGTSATFNVANLPSVIRRQRRVTGVSRVVTLTPTGAAGKTWTVKIKSTNVLDGSVQNFIYNYSIANDLLTIPSATQIVTALKTAINGDLRIAVTASGTSTLILTGDVGYWDFAVQSVGTGVLTATVDGASVTSGWINNTTQVATGSITNAATSYAIKIVMDNALNGNSQEEFVYTVPQATDALGTIAAFIALINADTRSTVTASGTSTLILTAKSGSKSFTPTNVGVGTINWAATTATNAALIGQGLGSYLINSQFNDSNFVAGTSYTSFFIPVETEKAVGGNDLKKQTLLLAIFVSESATNYESFAGEFGTLTQAVQGVNATWAAAAGMAQVTTITGAIALTAGSTFGGENIRNGDVIYFTAGTYYPVEAITATAAGVSTNKVAAGSPSAFNKVLLRRI
jgi:hypothetical protein